jgi:hypothetical protein
MHVRTGLLNWGIFLVALGVVPLAVQLNVLDRATASALLRLWPLILVGIGIGLLLRFSRAEALGGLLVAATFGLLGGVFLAGGIPSAGNCGGGQSTGPTLSRNGPAGSTLELIVELTCGDMTIDRATGGDWTVDVRAGDQTPTINASGTTLELRSVTVGGFILNANERESWHLVVPGETALAANMTVNAGVVRANLASGALRALNATFNGADATFNLAGATSDALTLNGTLNASSVGLTLAAVPTNSNFTINASSLELCAAPEIGLRVTYEETLSSNNFAAAGLTQAGSTWQSANYATAATRADLRITANVSSTTLNPQGGGQ